MPAARDKVCSASWKETERTAGTYSSISSFRLCMKCHLCHTVAPMLLLAILVNMKERKKWPHYSKKIMKSSSAAFGPKPTAPILVVQWLFRYSNPTTASASQVTHWLYDIKDVPGFTHTNATVTYIAAFTAAASTIRITTRWQLQRGRHKCGSVCPVFDSRTEWQLCRTLELSAPARYIECIDYEIIRLNVHIFIRSWHQVDWPLRKL